MNIEKLRMFYGPKWNPFGRELPQEALITNAKIKHFGWKVENLVLDGGFGLIVGESGLGKSVIFRLLHERLGQVGDISVAEFTRPQSGITDFYRELGKLFGIDFKTGNRFGGHQQLRDKWNAHINTTLFRPVLLIDESQEMHSVVLSELRLLASTSFDSKVILTAVLGGDSRLLQKLEQADLLPLKSRIRARLHLEEYTRDELIELLTEALAKAGNPGLMTMNLMETVADHSVGNPRTMMSTCDELLLEAFNREVKQLDEKFFIELFSSRIPKRRKK